MAQKGRRLVLGLLLLVALLVAGMLIVCGMEVLGSHRRSMKAKGEAADLEESGLHGSEKEERSRRGFLGTHSSPPIAW